MSTLPTWTDICWRITWVALFISACIAAFFVLNHPWALGVELAQALMLYIFGVIVVAAPLSVIAVAPMKRLQRQLRDGVVTTDLVAADVLKSVVDEQVRRIAIGAFSWPSGSYRLTLEGRATKEPLPVTVHVGDVVVHANMLTESDSALKKAAPDDARFAPVGDAVYGLEHLRLTPAEARVVIAMDGTKTIADLLLLMAPTSERVVRGLAAGLQCLHLAKFMGRGPAAARKISFF